jgi:DNA repair protein RecN (Recombination protein N)
LIESLRIESWVIVQEAELELGPGLNVLTGETGTGKSIVLGALSLLAGGRGSSDAVRGGSDRAVVEAVFDTTAWPEVEAELARRELPAEEHALAVQRTLTRGRNAGAGARSRVRVAGELVPAATLSDLFADRIEISSQHSSQTLLRPEVQGRLLDEFGGLLSRRDELQQGVAALRALDAELRDLREAAEERARRQDFLGFQLQEIADVALQPGEIDELEASHARLAHAERLLEDGRQAAVALVGDSEGADEANAVDRVSAALRRLEGLAQLDPQLEGLADRLRAQESELFEAGRDLERYLAGIDADPARLAFVEDRLGAVSRLQRKYGASEQEIEARRRELEEELATLGGADARITGLAADRERRTAGIAELARALSADRKKAARKLARAVESSLGDLAMPGARFEVALEPVEAPEGLPCGPAGAERVEFRFSANAGEDPRPLRWVASGGELSRVFLAVRNALRRSGGGMVLVFDEVDAGIGGRVAERVGRSLAELSRHHQVLCITHLPQIAALGDVHFRVRKQERKGQTQAFVERIEGAQRVEEIARMAGGESISEATRRHAAELLGARAEAAAEAAVKPPAGPS